MLADAQEIMSIGMQRLLADFIHMSEVNLSNGEICSKKYS